MFSVLVVAVPEAVTVEAVLELVEPPPVRRNLIVVQGARMMSSWSMPIMFEPFGESTPITRRETFWMRSSLPTGDSSWNSSRLIVAPMTQTLLPLSTSRSVNMPPSSMSFQSRTSR